MHLIAARKLINIELKEYIKLLNYNASENKKEILDKIFQTTMNTSYINGYRSSNA